MLLKHHADVNLQDDDGDTTPLHDALVGDYPKGDDLQVVQLLLEHSADVDVENKNGRTPLQLALRYGRDEIAQLLSEFHSRGGQT